MLPVIKWTGSKRSQAKEILKHFPSKITAYYEPFVGGGSVLGVLLESNIEVGKYIISDINKELIGIWKLIQNNPNALIDAYTAHWIEFNSLLITSDFTDQELYDHRKNYFNKVKEKFNKNHAPEDLFFLTRTSFSGLVRYNSSNEYNTSCHYNRPGIAPDKISKIIYQWHCLMQDKDIEFKCADYKEILKEVNKEDFVYMDPPYLNTSGIYYGEILFDEFWKNVNIIKGKWLVSYNSNTEKEVPEIYSKYVDILSGISSFRRIKNKGLGNVYERLYIK